jgi:hypothetical protein
MILLTSSLLTVVLTLVSVILKLESNKIGGDSNCTQQGIVKMSWLSRISVVDVVVFTVLVVLPWRPNITRRCRC